MRAVWVISITLPESGTKMMVTVKDKCFALVAPHEDGTYHHAAYWHERKDAEIWLQKMRELNPAIMAKMEPFTVEQWLGGPMDLPTEALLN